MSIFYNEGSLANTDLTKWNKTDTYTFTDISGLGSVTCHGPASGQYKLIVSGLPAHQRIRYKVFWHFVDSLDNEQSEIYIDGVLKARFRKSGFASTGEPEFSINSFASYTWVPATYSYAPYGNGSTANGYVIFDTDFFDHTFDTLTIDHVLGHDEPQTNEAMYLSHVVVEIFETVTSIITDGLYLHLDAGLGPSWPGRQKFKFRANLVGKNKWVDFTHYQYAETMPFNNFPDFLEPPPQAIAPVTTTTTSTTTTTTTEPPPPITVVVSSNLVGTILGHQLPLITFSLSQAVVAFTLNDVMHAGKGNLSNFSYDGQTTATATFTPNVDSIGSYNIFVPMNSIRNSLNVFNSMSNTLNLPIDTVLPEMAITIADTMLIAGEVTTALFTSTNVTATFTASDITFTGPITVSAFTRVTATEYSLSITPNVNAVGSATLQVPAGRYSNVVGNRNKVSNLLTFGVDTRYPSMTITTDDSALSVGETATITFTSNLDTSNFVRSGITTSGFGTLGSLSGSGSVYTSLYTPPLPDEIQISASNWAQPANSWESFLKLNGAPVASVGRGHMAAVFDTSGGNIKFVTSTTKDTYASGSETTALIQFLDAVPTGNLLVMTSFDATSVYANLRANLNTHFGGIRSDTWTSTRNSHIFVGYKDTPGYLAYEDIIFTGLEGNLLANVYGVSGVFTANVAAATYTSANGNPNLSSNLLTLNYDTRRPNMYIYSDDRYLTYGETTTVYFVASEPTDNFVQADITITGDGTLSAFTSVSDMLYSATLTPTSGVTGSVYLSVAENRFTNQAGNQNLASRLVKIDVMTVTTTTTTTTTAPTTTTTTTTPPPGPSGLTKSTYWTPSFATTQATRSDLLIEQIVDQGPMLTAIRPAVSITGVPLDNPQGHYSVFWDGFFRPSTTETYTFSCDGVDDNFYMWIGSHDFDNSIANLIVTVGGMNSFSLPLTAYVNYPIRLAYISLTGPQAFNFRYETPTIAKTNNLAGKIFNVGLMGVPATVSISPNSISVNEGMPLSFTITSTGVPVGTDLYWWFNNVSAIDFNDQIGTYQVSTLTGSNTTSNIKAQSYAGLVNLIYLRHLGRYPENTGAVNGRVSDLLSGAKTLEQIDYETLTSPEADTYKEGGSSYRRAGNFLTDGTNSKTITGTVVYDSRDEGLYPNGETANITVRLGSHLGPIVANCDVLLADMSTIHGDLFPEPVDLTPGYVHTMSFVTLGTRWNGSPMKIKVSPPDGTGPAISATNITITNGTWTQPSTNTHVQTFTIKVNDGYTSANPYEYFKLGAHVGVEEALFIGTANIRVIT